jgi:phage recombination protein Bet
MTTAIAERAAAPKASILVKMADRFSVEPNKLLDTLKATAFKSDKGVTNEQMISLLIVADQYSLNPFTKEIFAFPDKGGIVPVVGVDGWSRIINEHPQFDGVTFSYEGDGNALACTCTIHRKDRSHPIAVTEYLAECKRGTGPWGSHPRRMLRHKALIQAARLAFGFAGIYDEDEAHRMREMGAADEVRLPGSSIASVREAIAHKKGAEVVDMETGEVTGAAPAGATPATFDYLAAIKKIEACTDRETLGVMVDEFNALPSSPEKDAVMEAYRQRDEQLAGSV